MAASDNNSTTPASTPRIVITPGEPAGIGPDLCIALAQQPHAAELVVVADPALTRNTHTIRVSGRTGQFTLVLENVPAPDNPKTAWLACYSALAALKEVGAPARYGT